LRFGTVRPYSVRAGNAVDDDDIDSRDGGGTLVMPPQGPARASAPGSAAHEDDDPSTLLKPAPAGTLQMSAVERQPSAPQPSGPSPHPSYSGVPHGAPHPEGVHSSYPSHPSRPHVDPGPIAHPAQLWPAQQAHADPMAPPAKGRGLMPVFLGVAFGLALVLVVALIVIVTREPAAPATEASASASTHATADTSAPAPVPTTETTASAAPTLTGADAEAVAALEKLRTGIASCVKDRIKGLPGTSPAVPQSLAWLKKGPYPPLIGDFSTPFFSCTEFKLEAPMPFMLQWQVDKPGAEGTGVAWIDDDRDGKAERAYGFTGKLKSKTEIELGPVGPIDASRKVQPGR
jgi:hypothetical protein